MLRVLVKAYDGNYRLIRQTRYRQRISQQRRNSSQSLLCSASGYPTEFKTHYSSEGGELRWQALGLVARVALLLVAHAVRDEGENEVVRLISARRATRNERQRYDETRSQDAGG